MFILEFLLIVFLVAIAVAAFTIWRAWRRVHNAVNQFNQQFGSSAQQQNSSGQQHRTTTTDSGETIIDTRTEEQANQKIFGKDEGEYVDYKLKD